MPKVLIVEDHRDTLTMFSELMRTIGWEVVQATNFDSAIQAARQDTFDLLLCDIGLPDRSGNELVAVMRRIHPSLRAFAITGYGMATDIASTFASGFSEHFTKPVNIDALEKAIRAHRWPENT